MSAALKGSLGTELSLPSQFEGAAEMVTEDEVADAVVCGPDVDRHIAALEKYRDAGFDALWVHQVGPHQQEFFDAYAGSVLPHFNT